MAWGQDATSLTAATRTSTRRAGRSVLQRLRCVGPEGEANRCRRSTTGGNSRLPPGFAETTVFSGLTEPTAVRVRRRRPRLRRREERAHQGLRQPRRDTTPTVFADLRTEGPQLLGPRPARPGARPRTSRPSPYVYVLYTYDARDRRHRAALGHAGATSTAARRRPGPTDRRLRRQRPAVAAARRAATPMTGHRAGADRGLVPAVPEPLDRRRSRSAPTARSTSSGGDGASFNGVDYGQDGAARANPCGDPPGGSAATLTPPTAEGGALRSQDLRTPRRPASASTARSSASTRRPAPALPGNPLRGERRRQRAADRRLRPAQPVPLHRPARHERGLDRRRRLEHWEEIDRIADADRRAGRRTSAGRATRAPAASPATTRPTSNLCESLYAQAPARRRAVLHLQPRAPRSSPGESCPTGSSSIAGPRVLPDGGGPTRPPTTARCSSPTTRATASGSMQPGANGAARPDARVQTFVAGAAQPGRPRRSGPDGDLFYVDLDGGTIRRIRYTAGNQPPTAVATADPTSGAGAADRAASTATARATRTPATR